MFLAPRLECVNADPHCILKPEKQSALLEVVHDLDCLAPAHAEDGLHVSRAVVALLWCWQGIHLRALVHHGLKLADMRFLTLCAL